MVKPSFAAFFFAASFGLFLGAIHTSLKAQPAKDVIIAYMKAPEIAPVGITEEIEDDVPPEILALRDAMFDDMEKLNLEPLLKMQYIDEIIKQSFIYNIDPKLVYATIYVESTFNEDAKHKPTYVRKLKREVQALGLGGVVWEFWGSYLKKNTTLTQKSDLKDPLKNIEATAAILAHLASFEIHPKAQTAEESASIRYYGAHSGNYMRKIKKIRHSL